MASPGCPVEYWEYTGLRRLSQNQFQFVSDGQMVIRTFNVEDDNYTDQVDAGAFLPSIPAYSAVHQHCRGDSPAIGQRPAPHDPVRAARHLCGNALQLFDASQLQPGDLLIYATKPLAGCEVRNGEFFDGVVILITDAGSIDPGHVIGIALNKLSGEVRQGGPMDGMSTLNISMHVRLAEDDRSMGCLNEDAHELEGKLDAVVPTTWSCEVEGQRQSNQIRWLLWGRHPFWSKSDAFPDFPEEIPREKQPIRFFGVARWSILQLNDEVNGRGAWRMLRNPNGLISFLRQYRIIAEVDEGANEKGRTLRPMWADVMRTLEG